MINVNRLLTVFILPSKGNGEDDDVSRLKKSVPSGLCRFVNYYPGDCVLIPPVITPWWCLMYGNEWFDRPLAMALKTYCSVIDIDCFVFFKKVVINGSERYFREPRLFRSIAVETSMHVNLKGLVVTQALNGLVLEDDREE